jgi:AcrR family transcriptional regulator
VTDLPEVRSVPTRRALRADARRNYDKLVATATDMFATKGSAASYEEIARAAGVGSATLYRNFPTRQDLFSAVYVEQVEQLCGTVDDLGELDPLSALETWLRRFVAFIKGKRAFTEEMAHDSETVLACRERIYAAVEPLLARAQAAGAIRRDVDSDDVLRMLTGIGLAHFPRPGQFDLVVETCLRGLRE